MQLIAGGQSTPQKFQRTPRHSMVFEIEDTTKVRHIIALSP